MALKHRISFATDLAANFACNRFRIRLISFPIFCAPPSEVAVLFDSILSRLPFLGQVVDLDLLLCTGFNSEHAVLFLCHIFTQRPMVQWLIEQQYRKKSAQQNRPFHFAKLREIKIKFSERPKELGRWFCPLNLQLPSLTAFGEIARWPPAAGTQANLDSNLNSATWSTSCKGFIASETTA